MEWWARREERLCPPDGTASGQESHKENPARRGRRAGLRVRSCLAHIRLRGAGIGAVIAPAMAAMANSLFRMGNSFARRAPAFASAVDAGQVIACGIVPENRGLIRGISGELLRRLEPIEVLGGLLFRNRASGEVAALDSIPPHHPQMSMTITAAHVAAIVALVAG